MIGPITNMTEQQRKEYRAELIAYYLANQEYKNEQAVRRQVVNMDDPRLIENYTRVFGN
jgi:hypothetical protein